MKRTKIGYSIIAGLLIFTFIAEWFYFTPTKVEAANPTAIRQEVNITDAYLYAGSGSYATSSEIAAITDTSYTSPYYYFEVVASTTAGTTASIDLVNATSSALVKSISITGGNTYQRYRSTAFLPNASTTVEYKVRLNNEAIGKGLISSRIVVLQNNATISNTETQIEIGSATTTAVNTTSLPLISPKYWYYDSTKWDATQTVYAEATYKMSPVASSTTYNASATTTSTFSNYIASANVGYVSVEAWGPGGGGDGVTSAATLGGGGGGGGAYAKSTTTPTAGSTYVTGVGRGGAEGVTTTASTTLSLNGVVVVQAAGGTGSNSATGGAGGTTAASTGDVKFAGGSGGNGETTQDIGGGGGGSAGPDGAGGTAANAVNPNATAGAQGDNGLGGAGGAAGTGNNDTCANADGKAGVDNVKGAGGGGGASGDATGVCVGGSGGKPGGGGGGSDEGVAEHLGGQGRLVITENIGTVGIALQESDGTGDGFQNFAFKKQLVVAGKTSTTSERVRSSSFTPTSGRNYRIVASSTNATASFDIYNAKIVLVQANTSAATYYFDVSDAGPTDPNGVWSSDAEAFNNDTVTPATVPFASGGSDTLNYLMGEGTNAPTSGSPITQVRARLYANAGSAANSENARIYTDGLAENLGTASKGGSGAAYGSYVVLTTPSGGWTWQKINDLETKIWHSPDVTGSGSVYIVEVEVTSSGAVTLIEPQYLLAPYKLDTGTALQTRLTSYASSEWAGSTNAYYLEANAADNSTSVVTLNTSGGTAVTNGTVTSPDNRGRSTSSLCGLVNGDLDTKATTNNGDIYAVRIVVQVGGTPSSCGGATVIIVPRVLLMQGTLRQLSGKTIIQ